ncbi:MAG: oligoendopeptidase F [Desulfobacterales bacterium]|nr:MAG: oligoendopeptidase F [Desulfobacterales bacterium]
MSEKMIPERKDIPDEDQWDLKPLFDAEEKWEALYAEVEKQIETYHTFKGRLQESLTVFKEALEFHLTVSRNIDKLYTYAQLRNDEDKSNQFYLGMQQRALSLVTRAGELSSFMTPEIQTIRDDIITHFSRDEALKEFRFYLQKILRHKPHTLDERSEQILAMSREMAMAPWQVFGQLDNVDLNFGALTDTEGHTVELSHGNFTTFLMNPEREIRKRAFFLYYRAYGAHQNTLAATLSSSIKKDFFYARVRNFENCRTSALFDDDVPETVYDNLLTTVQSRLAPLFKYLDFRRRALGLTELHFCDTYVPLIRGVDFHMPYEKAADACVEALAPLGAEYTAILRKGLRGGWVDRYENRGKRSGAYSSGCYDSPPYILLNYEAHNINSLYTLIHEAGHSMHSYYSKKHQPYVDHAYTIFVAEVASTFNEVLLGQYLLRFYHDRPKMKAYIINREIDNIRATLFRQTMFAEFEKIIHHLVETRKPLTLEVITAKYRELLQIYFGDMLVIDPELVLECLRIPHFYSAFYVYKYATGVSAALALADKVLTEGNSAREAYLNFLKLGGSKFPLEELLEAGIDMRSPQPVERAVHHFEHLVDQLIEEYEKL